MASVKNNIILNGINTVTTIIFPVVTFPYAARVLLPEGIGAVNFLNSIIAYIILLTSLGIPMYAVKKVAQHRDDHTIRDRITIEILVISLALCILGYLAVWALATFIPQIHDNAKLFYVLSLAIVFTAIGVNWFYQGIEDFKFITIRAIIIRTLCAISLFIFIKNPSDIYGYALITVGTTVGNNVVNFFHLRKHIHLENIVLKELRFVYHILPIIHVFLLSVIISLYTQLTTIILGFLTNDEEVGYFVGGTKISLVAITLLSSIGTVLLPQCSHLIKSGDKERFSTIISKSLNLILVLSFPMAGGIMILAEPLINIFCGSNYSSSVPVLLWNAPVIIISNLNYLLCIQVLYPMDKLKTCTYVMLAGAIISITSCFILIPRFAATGASGAKFLTEISILTLLLIFGRKMYPFNCKDVFQPNYFFATSIMVIVIWLITQYIYSDLLSIIVGVTCGCIVYFLVLIILRDKMILSLKNLVFNKFQNILKFYLKKP